MGLVGGSIGQVTVRLRKVTIPVEDDNSVVLIGKENKDVGMVGRERRADFSGLGRLYCRGRVVGNFESETLNRTLNEVSGREFGDVDINNDQGEFRTSVHIKRTNHQ